MPETSPIVKCDVCSARIWGPVAIYAGQTHCADCIYDRQKRVPPIFDWPVLRTLVRLFR